MGTTVRRVLPFIRTGRGSRRLRTAPAVLALALLAFAAGGCEPEARSDTAIRSDSAGVMLVEYPSLPPIQESRIAIADEPDLVLGAGGAFAGPDYEFFRITGVSQLRDGTLVVANQGSSELRFYGADGHFLRSVGRNGDGPGEFRALNNHWIIAGDTIVVWDPSVARLQHFGPDGAFVRSMSMATAAPFAGFANWKQPQAFLEDGSLAMFIGSPGAPLPVLGPERRPLLVALHRIDEGGWDSVRVVPGTETGYQFGAYPRAAGAGATLAVADVARFRVELFNPDGRLVSILSASVPEIPITADVIEAQIELEVGSGWWPDPTAEFLETLRSRYYARHRPFLPAIRDIFVDADERIWVERYDVPARGASRWEVFERDGTWIGRVEMPAGFPRGTQDVRQAPYFSVASGRLAGVWRDSDTGVATVRVYRVIEPDS